MTVGDDVTEEYFIKNRTVDGSRDQPNALKWEDPEYIDDFFLMKNADLNETGHITTLPLKQNRAILMAAKKLFNVEV